LIEKEIHFQVKNYGKINTTLIKQKVFNQIKLTFEKKFFELWQSLNLVTLPSIEFGGIQFQVNKEISEMEFKEAIVVDAEGEFFEVSERLNILAKYDAQQKIDKEIQQKEIEKLTTKERYVKGYFDTTNIFELFGKLKFDENVSDHYSKLIFRLFQYRYFEKPSEKISDLNEKWVFNFFSYLSKNGYMRGSSKEFDPLNFDNKTFVNKKVEFYKPTHLLSLFKIFKILTNVLKDEFKNIPEINFDKIKIENLVGKNIKTSGLRKDHSLNFKELNKIFDFEFDHNNYELYQSIFDKKYNGRTRIQLTLMNFINAKDLFLLQIMGGGLRGITDLSTAKLNKSENTISFKAAKTKTLIINPLNEFTEPLAIKYDYQLPTMDIKRKDNGKQISISVKEHIYRAIISVIGEILNFDREINVDNELIQVKEIINPYFARKTFSQILYEKFRFSTDEISIFTGHSMRKSELVRSYINTDSIEVKRELSKLIKRAI